MSANTSVTDTAAEFLLRNSNLRVVDFSGTAITDKSVEHVKKPGGIIEIGVDKTKISIVAKSGLKIIKGLQVHE